MRLHTEERVADYTSAGWWTDETWDDLLRAQVSARPERLAVVDPPNRGDLLGGDQQRWTWGELGDRVDALAAVLLENGVGAGDVVGVQLPNGVELIQTYLALHRVGAVITPFPVSFREHELTQLGRLTEMSAVVTAARIADRAAAQTLVDLRADLPALATVLAFGPDAPGGSVDITAAIAAGPDSTAVERHLKGHEADANDCVTICWTSGTEAVPKGVLRASNDWIAIAKGSVDGAGLTGDDVLLNPFPMVNMAGIGGMLVPWLLTGATLVQHQPFDLPTFLKQIAVERPTYTVAPPALLNMLLANEAVLAAADLSSLRVIGSGSAPLSAWMIKGWKERFDIEVTNLFGSNEGIALIGEPTTIPDLDHRASYFPRFGEAGLDWSNRAAQGMRTKLVDIGDGSTVAEAGRPGELAIAGPTVFARYLLEPTDGRAVFDDDGFFRTGDVFELVADDEGVLRYFAFVDRAKDMIIRGGMNISPAEVESLIQSHPKVAEVAVVGFPDDVLGERACAVVVPKPGEELTLDEVLDHLRQQKIASYKLPERLEIVDALPRNPVGKVLKRELRTLVAASA